jgi:hypothetical protein
MATAWLRQAVGARSTVRSPLRRRAWTFQREFDRIVVRYSATGLLVRAKDKAVLDHVDGAAMLRLATIPGISG